MWSIWPTGTLVSQPATDRGEACCTQPNRIKRCCKQLQVTSRLEGARRARLRGDMAVRSRHAPIFLLLALLPAVQQALAQSGAVNSKHESLVALLWRYVSSGSAEWRT